MQRAIEFHDSELIGLETAGDWLVLSLDAYVHRWERIEGLWTGTGWMQPVTLRLKAAASATRLWLPVRVSEGSLSVGSAQLGNLVPLPYAASEAGSLQLVLVDGSQIELNCDGVTLSEAGPARYVERLPDDFRPLDAV